MKMSISEKKILALIYLLQPIYSDSKDETGTSIVTFSITGSYKELTDETEESGEAQSDTQTAQ
jgi:hypothetical protein